MPRFAATMGHPYLPAAPLSGPGAIRPLPPRQLSGAGGQIVTVVPGPPDGIQPDTLPHPDGVPQPQKKRGRHFWVKAVAYTVAMVLTEVLIK
jgi:hypothetical protein